MAKTGGRAARHLRQPVLRGHGADAGLTPDYALLGKVTDGMDVVKAIGKLGDPASGGAGTRCSPS